MGKWIGGCAVVALIAVALVVHWAYKGYTAFTAGGGVSIVTIAAPPERVFASLADADSIATWSTSRDAVALAHHGRLLVGDVIHGESIDINRTSPPDSTKEQFLWTVAEVVPYHLLVLEMRSDSGRVIATRRDSLVAVGDSTRIITTIASSAVDSLQANVSGHGKSTAAAAVGLGGTLMISAFRAAAQREMETLKTRIERGSTPRPHESD